MPRVGAERGISMLNITKRAAMGAMTAAMLATAIAGPVSAFAATTKSTDVKIKADDSNLTITVPTEIPFVMTPDGKLTASDMQIVNGSNFAIKVSDVAVAKQGGYTLVADASVATEDNAVDFQFGVDGAMVDAHNASAAQLTAGMYNMAPASDTAETDTLTIKATGDAKNIKTDISTNQTVAQVTWTFSAGIAQ